MIIIKNGNIVLPDEVIKKDILILHDNISKIDDNIDISEYMVIDATDKYIIPGLIDLNCELRDPGREHKEDMDSLAMAALAGGYTTVAGMPTTEPKIDNKLIVEYVKNKAKEECAIDLLLLGRCTKSDRPDELAEIGEMYKAGIVGVTDSNLALDNIITLENVFNYCKMFDLPIILSTTDEKVKNYGMIHDGTYAALSGIKAIPSVLEDVVVARNTILSRDKNVNVHITNITSKSTLSIIRYIRSTKDNNETNQITCDCTPHHMYFTDDDLEDFNSIYKVMPPLRSEIDKEGLINAVKDGTINCITSGHKPENIETKQRDFTFASYGVSSLETAFVAGYNKLVHENDISINKIVELYSKKPAEILGLKEKGEIKVGNIADLVIFDPDDTTKVNSTKFKSKAKYSMFDNMELKGKICTTIKSGKVLYSSEKIK